MFLIFDAININLPKLQSSFVFSTESNCTDLNAEGLDQYSCYSIMAFTILCFIYQIKSDEEHKMAGQSAYPEDTEILRVPLALAMVKLLQNLPQKTLEQSLPGYVIKIICLIVWHL